MGSIGFIFTVLGSLSIILGGMAKLYQYARSIQNTVDAVHNFLIDERALERIGTLEYHAFGIERRNPPTRKVARK